MTTRSSTQALLALAVLALAGCAGGARAGVAPPTADDCVLIGVWSNGFHTSLTVPGAAIPDEHPLRPAFPDQTNFLIGYGEFAYYQNPDPGRAAAVRAAIAPSQGTVHVIAGYAPVEEALWRPRSLTPIAVSQEGLNALVADIADALALDENDAPVRLAEGRVAGASAFLKARQGFHLFHMCNQWTTARLATAGVTVPRPAPFYADELVAALEARAATACPR